MLWSSASAVFYIAYPSLSGNFIVKSLKVYGLMGLFFISLAAVFMNLYVPAVQTFYLYSMFDAIILFPIVAIANGLIFPRLFQAEIEQK